MAERDHSFNATTATPITTTPHSPWHSPVPYLFGGLAAMLGLIAFALLILACSYWKLSGYLDNNNGEAAGEGENRDLEAGELGENQKMGAAAAACLEQKFLVIMAGDLKPTFLATPMSNSTKSSSFAENNQICRCSTEKGDKLEEETQESSSQDNHHH